MAEQTKDNHEALIGLPCECDGLLWTIAAYKKGWFTLAHSDGSERKARRDAFEVLEDEEEAAASSRMSETLSKYREKYVPTLAASGKKSLSCGDRLAMVLSGMSYEDVFAMTEFWCELATGSLEAKYRHLKNGGMRRMNAGNRLRALMRKGLEWDGEGEKPRSACFVEWLEDDEAIKQSYVSDGTFWLSEDGNEFTD